MTDLLPVRVTAQTVGTDSSVRTPNGADRGPTVGAA